MNCFLDRKINNLGFYSFLKILEHQSKKYECTIHYIDRFYPSSKTCSNCSFVYKDLKIKDRSWICPECNTLHDRDINASKNICRVGASTLGVEVVNPSKKVDFIDTRIP